MGGGTFGAARPDAVALSGGNSAQPRQVNLPLKAAAAAPPGRGGRGGGAPSPARTQAVDPRLTMFVHTRGRFEAAGRGGERVL